MNNFYTNFSINITNIPAAPPPSRVPLQTRQSVPAVNVLKYYYNVLNITFSVPSICMYMKLIAIRSELTFFTIGHTDINLFIIEGLSIYAT